MKFLTDENIASSVVKALRDEGYDVKDVKQSQLQGTPDTKLLDIALNEDRIIITHDKDFASVLTQKIRHKGIILLRLQNQQPENVKKVLFHALKNAKEKIQNNLAVISEKNIIIHK